MTIPILSITSVRRRTILASAIAGMVLAGAVTAALADTTPVDLTVVNRESGQPLRVWRHHGRDYVAGEPGARYALRVTNHTGARVLVVLSVDGVNVVSGETAGYDQRGYVLSPHETYDLTGWRKSDTEVAAFAFAPLPQSYAARTGRPGEVGVIGMAVFKEKVLPPPPPPPPPVEQFEPSYGSRDENDAVAGAAAPGALAKPAAPRALSESVVTGQRRAENLDRRTEKLGTAHGAREWSEVSETAFERSTPYPVSVRQIEYDTYANLVAAGVIPRWRAEQRHPRPFPTDPGDDGFVPDPPER